MFKKILLCFVLMLIFIGVLGVHAEGNETVVHTVRAGENLHILAERFYENSAYYVIDFIVEYNNIPNPDRILVGTVLKFPPLPQRLLPIPVWELPLSFLLMDFVPSEEDIANAPTHTVVAGDVLTNLAYKFYENTEHYIINFIARINGLANPNRLFIGMILMFPELPRVGQDEDITEEEILTPPPTLGLPIEDLSIIIHQTSVWLNPPPLFLNYAAAPTDTETIQQHYRGNEIFRLKFNHFMQNFSVDLDEFIQILQILGYIAFDMNGSVVHILYQVPIDNMIFRPEDQHILADGGTDGFIIFSW